MSGKLTNKETDDKPTVTWNGCRKLEDGNMEIEVDVNSVRHVPPMAVKYTMQKMQAAINSLKAQFVIMDYEVPSVYKTRVETANFLGLLTFLILSEKFQNCFTIVNVALTTHKKAFSINKKIITCEDIFKNDAQRSNLFHFLLKPVGSFQKPVLQILVFLKVF